MHGSVDGSGQRLVSSLAGMGTRCKPLKIDLRYSKPGYSGGTIPFRGALGLAICPRTCCIHQCFSTRSGSAAGVPNQLLSRTVGRRTSPATSRLHLPRSRLLIGQVPLVEEVVVPTAIPICTRGKAAGLRTRVQRGLHVPACKGCVPALHGCTVSISVRSYPPRPSIGSSRARQQQERGSSPASMTDLPRSRQRQPRPFSRRLPLAVRPPKATLCGAVGRGPH